MKLKLFDKRAGITRLGPGKRFGIWTQGCPRHCPGCMTPESQSMDGGYEIGTDELAEEVLRSGLTGLTISGGEPFLQPAALSELIGTLRRTADIGVIVYTGYTYEELVRGTDEQQKLLSQCDLIIDGPYIDALNDGKGLRGSSNQRAVHITERYRDRLGGFGAEGRAVEFFIGEEKTVMIGVPSRELLDRIRKQE